jgi:SAM-dependent methyltransferase
MVDRMAPEVNAGPGGARLAPGRNHHRPGNLPCVAPVDTTRAFSFGGVAESYDRYRPGPPREAVEWVLPTPCPTALDLGAGTGALSRRLAERASQVIAVEPDPRMLAVLTHRSPTIHGLRATAERLPIGATTVDAVLVSSAWHWMDPELTMAEIGRVLRSGGVMGVVWSGPDRSVDWVGSILGRRDPSPGESVRRNRRLELPVGSPFHSLDTTLLAWSLPMTRGELVGLAGTYSSVITMAEEERVAEADRIEERLATIPGLGDRPVVDLPMSTRCWRAVRR